VSQIEAMYRMGARTFVEVGPDAKLTALVRAILEGRDHQAIAVDVSRGASGNVADLACTLACLAARGYAVDLTGWDGAYQPAPAKAPGLTVKLCGANPRAKAAAPPPVPVAAPVAAAAAPFAAARSVQSQTAAPLTGANAVVPAPMPMPVPSARPAQAAPEGIVVALEHARQSLVALERLAEQTAQLHRQFLEGQATTQQSLLKLLEHEQRLSWALIGARPELAEQVTPAALPAESPRVAVPGDVCTARREPRPPESCRVVSCRDETAGGFCASTSL
jgi:acyl transferase domain-containing protein